MTPTEQFLNLLFAELAKVTNAGTLQKMVYGHVKDDLVANATTMINVMKVDPTVKELLRQMSAQWS